MFHKGGAKAETARRPTFWGLALVGGRSLLTCRALSRPTARRHVAASPGVLPTLRMSTSRCWKRLVATTTPQASARSPICFIQPINPANVIYVIYLSAAKNDPSHTNVAQGSLLPTQPEHQLKAVDVFRNNNAGMWTVRPETFVLLSLLQQHKTD